MAYLAGTIVNNVRDLIPDPIYSASIPQPDADGGLFRAQTLYRWLDDGVRLITNALGWTLSDWTAVSAVTGQAVYSVNPLFLLVDQAYAKQQMLLVPNQVNAMSIQPSRTSGAQADRAYIYRVTDHLEVGFSPLPNYTDVATTLSGGVTAGQTTLPLTSAASFLSYGYALIESELVQYQVISGNTLEAVTRGAGGTAAVAHAGGAAATHCSLWLKGSRSPVTITDSTSVVEVPLGWVSLLNTYLLAQCRQSENEDQVAARLLKEFDVAVEGIRRVFASKDFLTRGAISDLVPPQNVNLMPQSPQA